MLQTVALMSVFGIGMIFSIIGAFKLEIARVLNIDDGKVGGLISSLMLTSMVMVLLIGPLVDYFGHKPLAIMGFLVGCAAVFMLIHAKSYGMAVVSCIMLGIGGMALNTVGNTLLPVVLFGGQNAPAASNLGNTFFGLGAFITPFIVGMLLKRMGYKVTGTIVAILLLLPVVIAIMASYPEIHTGFSFANAFGLLTNSVIIMSSLALFCYIGLEISMGGWITTYATSLGFTERGSSFVLSAFWITVMIARLITAALVTPAIGTIVIAVLAIIGTGVIGLMIVAKSKFTAALSIIVTGLAFGPIFPTIVGVTFSKIDASLFGSAFGIIFAIGLLGGSTIPAAIGVYSKGKTIQKSLMIAMAAAFVLFIIAIVMGMV
jgi:fucose permease